jgi:short chain dehydrogenase
VNMERLRLWVDAGRGRIPDSNRVKRLATQVGSPCWPRNIGRDHYRRGPGEPTPSRRFCLGGDAADSWYAGLMNVIGELAATQTFLNALRVGRSRIVNVGSLSGLLATPITGPYGTSKFALEGMTDVLRRELLQQGIAVVMVVPGGVKTPIMGKINRRIEQAHEDRSPS